MAQLLKISPYDPRWVLEFEKERDRIARALGTLACRIDHNGSTAVPGLEAKPVIDIQVSVARPQPLHAYGEPLATLGYVHVPHVDDAVCPYFRRPHDGPHTHHVHVVQASGLEERRTLAFRDYLREHVDTAREYVALKKHLAIWSTQGSWLAKVTRTQKASSSTMWLRLRSRQAIRAGARNYVNR